MPRFLCAAVFLFCATLRAATGFPELPGFFTESTAGVYQARGALLAVSAGPGEVRFGSSALIHSGASWRIPVGVDPTGGIVNTYVGGRASIGRPMYRAVEYRDIYPGITLRLSFEGRAVKADYLVAAGANPSAIRFRYSGAEAHIEDGNLIAGEIRQPEPAVFQGDTKLPAHYAVDGNWVCFEIAPHDRTRPMVIDPYVIAASSYVGGALHDRINAIAVDASGYLYIAGATEVPGVEAFVMKLHPSTMQVVYVTYLSGTAEDRARAIAVDSAGSVYVAGFTASTDFPALPAYGGGSTDAFVARLNASGGIQSATFLGGSGTDAANGIALKPNGEAWIVGETTSSNLPLAGAYYQATNRGGQDAFLARVNSDGSIAYTGYFGGSGEDRAVAAAVDVSGEVYFTGGTTSANFPYANAYRTSNAGQQDAFIAKLSADGSALRYSTYLGGSGGTAGLSETGNWIGVDSTGAALVVGTTGSTDFPFTVNAVQTVFGGGSTDAFLAKLSPAGTSLLYSTFFGGSSTDEGWAGALASDGTFYLGGNTASTSLAPVDALQTTHGGDVDGFFTKLSSGFTSVLAFSYLGYTGTDSISGIAVTPSALFLAGSSLSPSWLPSGGYKGLYDGWVMKLSETALQVQIASTPTGIPFNIAGTGCSPSSATTPATVGWMNGSSCVVSFNSIQGSGDTRSVFQSWADGGSANPRTIVASAAQLSYAMQFGTEHRLVRTVTPAGAGTVSGIDGYYSAGAAVNLTAAASAGYAFSSWSGAASGSSNPLTVTMDAPKTITANFTLTTTFNSAVAVPLTISGAGCAPGTYTAPVTLAWSSGASCSVNFGATLTSGNTRWLFSRWSDGPTTNPRTFAASAGAVYTIEWSTEYRLTRSVTPASAGSVSAADGFYAASSNVQLTATAASGYQFANWSGDASGSGNPVSVVMTGPKAIVANFAVRTTQVTIGSNVATMQLTVSGAGCNPGSYTTPAIFTWNEGTVCNVSTSAVQGGDVRWVFERWEDGPTEVARSITATGTTAAYTMRFATQYKLTRLTTGQGSVSGVDGFYAAGSSVQLTATPVAGYQFTGWSGNAVSAVNPLTFTMNSPSTITANFSAAPVAVSIDSNAGTQLTVSGSGCPAGVYTAPTSIVWTNGVTCLITIQAHAEASGTRWVFANWTDGSPSNPRSITATPGAAFSIRLTAEHKLTRLVTGQGSVNGSDGFYAAGSSVQLTPTAQPGYQFAGWSGSAGGTAIPLSVIMDAPKTITASFTAAPVSVRIDSNVAVQFSQSGPGCSSGTYTAPVNVTWTTGADCLVTVQSPGAGGDSRWVFSKWADGSLSNPRTLTGSPGATHTIVMAPEYKLTRLVSGSGSVSGADGFYAAGASVQLTPAAQGGYQFSGWSGSESGSAVPLNIVMNAPKTVTANFTAIPAGVRIDTNLAVAISVSGAGCPAGAYMAPITLTWGTGTACTVSVQQPAAGADTRWKFAQWSDGSPSNPRTLTASGGAVYSIVMSAEYTLTRLKSGPGSVSGSDGFYAAGSTVQLVPSPQAGYQFTGWSGSASGSAVPLNLVMDGPKIVTAGFAAAPTAVRFDTNTTVQFTVSGANCPTGTYTAPTTISWPNGTGCNISVPSPQGSGDIRWAFAGWADSPSNPRTLTASPGAAYGIVMAAEYRMTRNVSGPGSISSSDGFYAAGSTIQLTATAQAGYQFTGWSGAADGLTNPLNVVMNGPKSLTAHFGAAPTGVRIEANTPVQISVSGSGCPANSYTAPITLTWTNGSSCTISVVPPQAGGDTQWVFAGWSDGSQSASRSLVASPGATYTVVMNAQHRLTRGVSGPGSVSGADGFYAAGSSVALTATPQGGYQFAGWSGSVGGAANPLNVVMDGPKTIIANFVAAPLQVRIDSNAATQFVVSGTGCPAGAYTAPANIIWANGAGCDIAVPSPQGGGDTRLVFGGWTDGSPANPRRLTAAPGAVYSIAMTTEYRLTRGVAGAGSVSGEDGFYPALSNVQLSAIPAAGHQFVGWSGTGGGAANPVTIRLDGPTTMIANFTPIPVAGVTVEHLDPLIGAGGAGSFTATFSHGAGATELYLGYILFLPTSNIVQYTATGSCLVEYNRISHGMRLIDDAGTGWLGPPEGVRIGPSAGTLSNSLCTVNLSAASASISGNTMSVTAPVTFKSALSPVLATFLQAQDVKGNWTGMTQFGNWVPATGTPRPGPSIPSVGFSATAGSSVVYAITASHTSGVASLSMVHLLVSTAIVGGTPCQVVYFPGANTLNLVNDNQSALVAPGSGVQVGVGQPLANSRCSVNTAAASRSVSGNNVTIAIPMNFQPGTFGGPKNVYVNAFDDVGRLTHWVQGAVLTVQ